MAVERFEGGTVITGPHIELYRLKAIETALRLDIKGIRVYRGQTPVSILRNQYGFPRESKVKTLERLQNYIKEKEAKL